MGDGYKNFSKIESWLVNISKESKHLTCHSSEMYTGRCDGPFDLTTACGRCCIFGSHCNQCKLGTEFLKLVLVLQKNGFYIINQ